MAAFAWYLRTGHGDSIHFGPEPPQCVMSDAWKPLYDDAAVAALREALSLMNALAKGPAGGVTRRDKLEAIASADAALAGVQP